jgi:hypothetical protein
VNVEAAGNEAGPFATTGVTAWCPAGKVAVAGGFFEYNEEVDWSHRTDDGKGWEVHGETGVLPGTATAYAVCANG